MSDEAGALFPDFETRARREIVELASAFVGCGMGGGQDGDPDAYLDLIANGETPARAAVMDKESGCALVVRGLWRSWGCVDKRLVPPYHDTTAVSLLAAMARECGAWRTGHLDELAPGDVVVLAGPEHVLTVQAIVGNDVISVDGGQRDDAGLECIKREDRKLVVAGSGATLGGRAIEGWISWPTVAWRFLNRPENL